jgi:hypothetical protein
MAGSVGCVMFGSGSVGLGIVGLGKAGSAWLVRFVVAW